MQIDFFSLKTGLQVRTFFYIILKHVAKVVEYGNQEYIENFIF